MFPSSAFGGPVGHSSFESEVSQSHGSGSFGGRFQHFSWTSRMYDPNCSLCREERNCGRIPEHHRHCGDASGPAKHGGPCGSEGQRPLLCHMCAGGCACHRFSKCCCIAAECGCRCVINREQRSCGEASRQRSSTAGAWGGFTTENASMMFKERMLSEDRWTRRDDFYAPFQYHGSHSGAGACEPSHYQGGHEFKIAASADGVQSVRVADNVNITVSADVNYPEYDCPPSRSTVVAEKDEMEEMTEKVKVKFSAASSNSTVAHTHTEACEGGAVLKPDAHAPPPQPRGCSWLCRIFCSGLCSIPYNSNARFHKKNFRLYPDYDFLPDNAVLPTEIGIFPKHTVSANHKRIKLVVPHIYVHAPRVFVDIVCENLVVRGEWD
ncbi:hypothetical protein EV182_002770, partial [Spiromyces aspiralis]